MGTDKKTKIYEVGDKNRISSMDKKEDSNVLVLPITSINQDYDLERYVLRYYQYLSRTEDTTQTLAQARWQAINHIIDVFMDDYQVSATSRYEFGKQLSEAVGFNQGDPEYLDLEEEEGNPWLRVEKHLMDMTKPISISEYVWKTILDKVSVYASKDAKDIETTIKILPYTLLARPKVFYILVQRGSQTYKIYEG